MVLPRLLLLLLHLVVAVSAADWVDCAVDREMDAAVRRRRLLRLHEQERAWAEAARLLRRRAKRSRGDEEEKLRGFDSVHSRFRAAFSPVEDSGDIARLARLVKTVVVDGRAPQRDLFDTQAFHSALRKSGDSTWRGRGGATTVSATCATLTLPASYDEAENAEADGQTFKVWGKRFRREGGPTPTKTLWMLQGGPGADSSVFDYFAADMLDQLGEEWEVGTMDHRGTGRSTFFECEDIYDGYTECFEELEAKFGSTGYFSTTNAAHDLKQFVDAVDTDNYLYGVSYGTFLLNRFQELFPDTAEVVVLDGVCNPMDTENPCALNRAHLDEDEAVKTFLENQCATSADCRAELGQDPYARALEVKRSIRGGHCPQIFDGRTQTYADLISIPPSTNYSPFNLMLPILIGLMDSCTDQTMPALINFLDSVNGYFRRVLDEKRLMLDIAAPEEGRQRGDDYDYWEQYLQEYYDTYGYEYGEGPYAYGFYDDYYTYPANAFSVSLYSNIVAGEMWDDRWVEADLESDYERTIAASSLNTMRSLYDMKAEWGEYAVESKSIAIAAVNDLHIINGDTDSATPVNMAIEHAAVTSSALPTRTVTSHVFASSGHGLIGSIFLNDPNDSGVCGAAVVASLASNGDLSAAPCVDDAIGASLSVAPNSTTGLLLESIFGITDGNVLTALGDDYVAPAVENDDYFGYGEDSEDEYDSDSAKFQTVPFAVPQTFSLTDAKREFRFRIVLPPSVEGFSVRIRQDNPLFDADLYLVMQAKDADPPLNVRANPDAESVLSAGRTDFLSFTSEEIKQDLGCKADQCVAYVAVFGFDIPAGAIGLGIEMITDIACAVSSADLTSCVEAAVAEGLCNDVSTICQCYDHAYGCIEQSTGGCLPAVELAECNDNACDDDTCRLDQQIYSAKLGAFSAMLQSNGELSEYASDSVTDECAADIEGLDDEDDASDTFAAYEEQVRECLSEDVDWSSGSDESTDCTGSTIEAYKDACKDLDDWSLCSVDMKVENGSEDVTVAVFDSCVPKSCGEDLNDAFTVYYCSLTDNDSCEAVLDCSSPVGLIIGIVAGVIGALLIICIAVLCVRRRRRKQQQPGGDEEAVRVQQVEPSKDVLFQPQPGQGASSGVVAPAQTPPVAGVATALPPIQQRDGSASQTHANDGDMPSKVDDDEEDGKTTATTTATTSGWSSSAASTSSASSASSSSS